MPVTLIYVAAAGLFAAGSSVWSWFKGSGDAGTMPATSLPYTIPTGGISWFQIIMVVIGLFFGFKLLKLAKEALK